MSNRTIARTLGYSVIFFVLSVAGSIQAFETPDRAGLGQAEFRAGELNIDNRYYLPAELPAQQASKAAADLAALGMPATAGRVDVRGGRWATLLPASPLLPGQGVGNDLRWSDLGIAAPASDSELAAAALQATNDYLQANGHLLRIDTNELAEPGRATVYRGGAVIQVFYSRVFEGLPVRGSHLAATINHGNLVLMGMENWGDVGVSTAPQVSERAAQAVVEAHVAPYESSRAWGKTELILVPAAKGLDPDQVTVGEGLEYRLAWVIRPAFDGDLRRFEALVDAHSGKLLSFQDTNHYAEVKGGVYPVTNDGIVPDGVEQPGWPMPFQDVATTSGTQTTDTGGNLTASGSMTATFFGPYVNINDNCGADSLTQSDGVDWGTSGGIDCVTPGFGGAGNTHASRTGFYELNKVIEMARGQLPANGWLQNRLTSNMNINNTCNAFWNGTVNFYRSGGGCSNTGEIAGVFDHEWGHGMDANDATPGIAGPSGEGIADIYTALRLNDSCIGRNFRPGFNCSGFGDPCLSCTGVRDIDYLMRASGQPHDYTWSNANCGGIVHCVGAVYAEAVWSLWKRELQGPPYNYDNNTAHEIVNRLTFIGAGNTGTWFSGGPPNGGCAGTSGYMNYLAADDDNGNLADGTPHMTAIYNAFNDQEIACGTPAVLDAGCAGTPGIAPTVTTSAGNQAVSLDWAAVPGATEYEVFRTEGVFACDFGKVLLGSTVGTSWNDSGLQNGRDYSYVVIPKGPSDGCFGPASACATSQPALGPDAKIDAASTVLTITSGDGDDYIDNCETATLTFDVINNGLGGLTNVRITGVTVVGPAGTTIDTAFPVLVTPSSLAEGASGSGSFDVTAHGLAFGDTLVLEVSVTADELAGDSTGALTIESAETDLQSIASKTWDFETDLDGWTLIQGTFNQTTSGGGAGGSAGYVASSAFLDNQCDQVRSPAFRLTASSTLTLENNYQIENFSSGQWWDRANVAFFEDGARNAVNPDGGRLYNASGAGATCVTTGQSGWANVNGTWGSSSWSSGALGSAGRAGQTVQLDVAYGTDFALNGKGFWFDKVTVTDIEILVADGQSDDCDSGCTIDADCDNGLYCDGAETCNAGTGICEAGAPVVCDDGVSCTIDSCNEGSDSCDNATDNGLCDNGVFCDGAEICNAVLGCQNGTPPTCNDGVTCTIDSCNVGSDSCDNVTDNGLCNNGAFCDGDEFCDATLDCQAGTPVECAAGEVCDEAVDECVVPPAECGNGICEAGEDCDSCAADCISGEIPGAVCGNGICEAGNGENASNCSADCNGMLNGKPSNRFSCGPGGPYATPCSDPRCTAGGYECTEVPAPPAGNFCCGDSVCEGDEDTSSCSLDCTPPPEPFCGNGIIELGEICDGPNLADESCTSLGYTGGTLACASDCFEFDVSACTGDICVPTHSNEKGPRCSDGVDNDCDGLIDGADPDC